LWISTLAIAKISVSAAMGAMTCECERCGTTEPV
jgi:hypothetical protein